MKQVQCFHYWINRVQGYFKGDLENVRLKVTKYTRQTVMQNMQAFIQLKMKM